jgi:hypothetical protein
MVTPSGPAAAASANANWSAVTHHFVGKSSHRAVLAVHFKGRFGAGHVFGADHQSGARWAV